VNLFEATKKLWGREQSGIAARWAEELRDGLPRLVDASKLFNEPKGLRFYVTVGDVSKAGRARGSAVGFSVRHRGQEVAKLTVGKDPTLIVSKKHEATNREYLKVSTPAGRFAWTGREGRSFRKLFKASAPGSWLRSEEHEYESRILEELEARSSKKKFGGTFSGVRHCGLTTHEYPVQFPVPISANNGTPVPTRGNVDILVRRQRSRRTRLSVWELKRPGAFQHALSQAYIYAVTLALMARDPAGDEWYRLFKFAGGAPNALELEAVVVITADQVRNIPNALEALAGSPLELPGLRATISLHAAVYDPRSLALSWIDLAAPRTRGDEPPRLRG
jgi:hypothetical protein